ncbi:MAG TPA: sugar phosphate isomerase/epimerase [Oscillospiraceae bacterium]|nr:sugar phosphate isomerase/epimerase [Oscillospiraceae bacterium]HPS35748.1 sugar phosphate isomerase/epimerase [Oscillospiraceae bacterium]
MKLGVLTVLFSDRSLEDTLKYLAGLGIDTVEIGCGGFPGRAHCDPEILLSNQKALDEFKAKFKHYGIGISALSAHGNAVHPDKAVAATAHDHFIKACQLAQKLDIDRVVTFSGCPGDHAGAKYPNWVTCPWPDDFLKILDWQWDEVLVPYWKNTVKEAAKYGIEKIAFEMHPGFCVYNTETMLKIRDRVGKQLGANFDPSHLWWQDMDPVEAIYALKGAIYHFHAKDTKVNPRTTRVNGVLDTKHFSDEPNRSWIFRTVGYGHGEDVWRDIVSALRLTGYDYVMSIEHEDSLMTPTEGLEKAVDLLRRVIAFEPKPGGMWWA